MNSLSCGRYVSSVAEKGIEQYNCARAQLVRRSVDIHLCQASFEKNDFACVHVIVFVEIEGRTIGVLAENNRLRAFYDIQFIVLFIFFVQCRAP